LSQTQSCLWAMALNAALSGSVFACKVNVTFSHLPVPWSGLM
jgi:hypothetical protein